MAELDPNVDWGYVANLVNQIRSTYPNMAWMLDVPELADVILKAGIEQWDEGRVVAAAQATQWWKDRNAQGRAFEQLQQTDPGSANQQADALRDEMLRWAGAQGFNLTEAQAQYIARESLVKGRTPQEWQANITNWAFSQGQSPVALGTKLNQLAAEYAVPISGETLKQWERNVLTGKADEATFTAYLQEQAKSLFPSLSNAIDRGITVRQYVAPYQEVAVQELGVNPAEIDWRDPKWSAAIHRIDPRTGDPVAMSLSDWSKELRTNSIYGFDSTQKAQEQASQLSQALLDRFGRAA